MYEVPQAGPLFAAALAVTPLMLEPMVVGANSANTEKCGVIPVAR